MPERLKQLPDEVWNFLIKVLPYSIAAMAIGLSIQIKNNTATWFNSTLSIIIGISCAWITGGFITNHFKDTYPIIIGVVTIGGEKVAYWLIYQFKFDTLGEALIEYIKSKLTKK